MNPYLRALLRFWWVLAIGLALACVAAVAMLYRIELGLPPKLTARAQSTYATTARLLLTSRDVPYLRTGITQPVQLAGGPTGAAAQAAAVEERPDIGILVRAANLYPLLIEGDDVAELRQEMFGPLRGTVSSQGVFSFINANRYEPTTLPVVEIFATSDSESGAINLANGTVEAFRRYILNQQNRAGVKPDERILVEPLQRPRSAVVSGGSSLALPVLLVFALLAGFAALAILLDRLFPPAPQHAGAPVGRIAQRVRVSDTA